MVISKFAGDEAAFKGNAGVRAAFGQERTVTTETMPLNLTMDT